MHEIESTLLGVNQLLIFAQGKKQAIEGAKVLTKESLARLNTFNEELNNPVTTPQRKEELLEEIYNLFNIRSEVIKAPLELKSVIKEEKGKIKIQPIDIITFIVTIVAIIVAIVNYYLNHR